MQELAQFIVEDVMEEFSLGQKIEDKLGMRGIYFAFSFNLAPSMMTPVIYV